MSKGDEVLSIGGLAKWLDVDRDTVRAWVEQERVPFFRIGDYVGFRRDTLLRWIAHLERENPANREHVAAFGDAFGAVPVFQPTVRLDPDESDAAPKTQTLGISSERDG